MSNEELAWARRMKAFLDTRDYGLVSEDDLDRLNEHWKMCVRLHNLDLSDIRMPT